MVVLVYSGLELGEHFSDDLNQRGLVEILVIAALYPAKVEDFVDQLGDLVNAFLDMPALRINST